MNGFASELTKIAGVGSALGRVGRFLRHPFKRKAAEAAKKPLPWKLIAGMGGAGAAAGGIGYAMGRGRKNPSR